MNIRFFLCFLIPFSLSGQSVNNPLKTYEKEVRVEKLYVAHDKPFYIPGDIIWAKMWMINGITHERLTSDNIVYVDWVDPSGKVITNEIVKLSKGQSDFNINTKRVDVPGNYTLRAYTLYQMDAGGKFIFQKSIKLINSENSDATVSRDDINTYELQFFPEGGYLINGLQSRVAFEIRDSLGIVPSMDVDIIDANGGLVTNSSTNVNGIGVFSIEPEFGKKYFLRCSEGDDITKYQLPKALAAGSVMSIRAIDEYDVHVAIRFSENIKGQVFKLLGHVRGVEMLNKEINTSESFNQIISRYELPSGIVHLTLFDAFDRPIAERLVFNRNPNEAVEVVLRLDTKSFERGKFIKGQINTQHRGEEIPSSIIMSVYNANLIDLELNDVDIENYLLLQSDIAEPIPNLFSYFDPGDEDLLSKMDLLMMTQFWRRFNWLKMEDLIDNRKSSLSEDSYAILGKVVNRFTKHPTKADVILTALGANGSFVNTSMVTGADGLFVFRGLDLVDTTDIFLQAGKYKKPVKNIKKKDNIQIRGDREVEIEWIRYEQNPLIRSLTYTSYMDSISVIEEPRNSIIEAKNYITSYDLEGEEWSIDLESITISANRNKAEQRDQNIRNRYKELGLIFVPRSEKHEVPAEFLEESYHVDIFEVIARIVPSATTMYVDGQKTISVGKGSAWKSISRDRSALETDPPGEPLILVNGQRLERGHVAQIDPESLLYIDIVKEFEALALYNSKRTVYNLLLKDDVKMFEEKISGRKAITFPGYHKARTFYRRANVSTENDKDGKDYSTTLYWNPDINISKKPFAFEFETADLPGRHCIYIQGLTNEGIPFVRKRYFVVE